MANDPLFTAADLSAWLQADVTDATATMIERVVWGWLSPALGQTARPATVSDQLFSWAVELGGIAHENPSGLSAYQLGEERSSFSSARREEILEEARSSASGGPNRGGVPKPVGSFPCAPSTWPS